MTTVSFETDVAAPAERAWAVISDPWNLPHWERHIEHVEGVPPEGLRKGARYVTVMRFMRVHARIACEVLEWEPPHRSMIQLRGVLDAKVTSTITPDGEDRCRLGHRVAYRFRGGPLGGLAARSLALVGGAGYALRRGTLAQRSEIEERRS